MSKYILQKTSIVWLLVVWLLPSGCGHTIDPITAFNVAGTYQFIGYRTSTLSDDQPDGEINLTQLDNEHVNIVVKGTSGKIKISYSYQNVFVVGAGQNSADQDTYSLLYKGHQIGVAGNDGISRYVDLYPSSSITLKAVEF